MCMCVCNVIKCACLLCNFFLCCLITVNTYLNPRDRRSGKFEEEKRNNECCFCLSPLMISMNVFLCFVIVRILLLLSTVFSLLHLKFAMNWIEAWKPKMTAEPSAYLFKPGFSYLFSVAVTSHSVTTCSNEGRWPEFSPLDWCMDDADTLTTH